MKILLVGHISYDIRQGNQILGGPPLYQLPVLVPKNIEIHVITSTHDISRLPKYNNCSFFNVSSQKSTTIEFKETNHTDNKDTDDRYLRLLDIASPITAEDIADLADPTYDIVIASPIVGELVKNSLEKIASLSTNSFLDMQGIVRKIDDNGSISNSFRAKDLLWALKTYSCVKISRSEFPDANTFQNDARSLLLVTHGGSGFDLYQGSLLTHVSTKPENQIIDATGSGDIFLATFAYYSYFRSQMDSILIADSYARKNLKNTGLPPLNFYST
jgi:hypothetical protein